MDWNLKRIQTMWDDVEVTPPKDPEFRVNRYNSTMVHQEIKVFNLQEVPAIFARLQTLLEGRCVDFQLVFDGPCPRTDLKALGFAPRAGESRIWNLSHPEYRISAISVESTNAWIIEVMKRSGRGILSDAARLDFLNGSANHVIQLKLFSDGLAS
ncbi:hypothetical protein [Paenibacillus abyssi]|uniref:Uncharacterized protein n=1 Tax=Paenibacillus abyssi TaxID=1340531 RepID=A0A917G2E3_9BACL|nr:hypothetical protein [Paenibacillus abyssi]GGG18607.1 hypothetical protein GCM10010916_39270 [Paenibacillus abyssi]